MSGIHVNIMGVTFTTSLPNFESGSNDSATKAAPPNDSADNRNAPPPEERAQNAATAVFANANAGSNSSVEAQTKTANGQSSTGNTAAAASQPSNSAAGESISLLNLEQLVKLGFVHITGFKKPKAPDTPSGSILAGYVSLAGGCLTSNFYHKSVKIDDDNLLNYNGKKYEVTGDGIHYIYINNAEKTLVMINEVI